MQMVLKTLSVGELRSPNSTARQHNTMQRKKARALFSEHGIVVPIEQRSEFLGWLQSAEASAYIADLKSDYARGISNLSFGLIMLGLKRLIDAVEDRNNANVTQMTAKKDLGNWPPSV